MVFLHTSLTIKITGSFLEYAQMSDDGDRIKVLGDVVIKLAKKIERLERDLTQHSVTIFFIRI